MGKSSREDGSGTCLDEVFDVLRHPYRRRLLLALGRSNPRDFDEFTTEDFAEESHEIEELRTALHHRHLPKLAEGGFIEWDEESESITRGPRYDEIAPLLKLMSDHADELPNGWP